jgi:hypothetical protein
MSGRTSYADGSMGNTSRASSVLGMGNKSKSSSNIRSLPVQKTTPFKLNIKGMQEGNLSGRTKKKGSFRDPKFGESFTLKHASSRMKRLRRWEKEGAGRPAGLSVFEELRLRASDFKDSLTQGITNFGPAVSRR